MKPSNATVSTCRDCGLSAPAGRAARPAEQSGPCTCIIECRCIRAARRARRIRYAAAALAVGALLLAGLAAQADVLVADTGGQTTWTLQQVIDAGGLRVGDLTFSDFRVVSTASADAWAPSAGEITVSGLLADGAVGLTFSGSWAAQNGGTADTTLAFKVVADSPRLITDNALWSTAHGTLGGGLVMITENVYDADPRANPSDADAVADELVYYAGPDDNETYDHQDFALGGQPVALPTIYVVKDIHVLSDEAGSRAALSEFHQAFGEIPEPATLALLAAGAAGLLGRRRRR